MKQHKWALIASIIATVISLSGFLCSALIDFCGNGIVRDICAALFSSSVFVIALSIIGYNIEKHKLQEQILSNKFFGAFGLLLCVLDDTNHITRQGVNTFIMDLLSKTTDVFYIFKEYYCGLIIKDQQLKELINVRLREFVRDLSELEVYTAHPKCKSEVIALHINDLLIKYQNLTETIYSWMETEKIKMGNIFERDENFILQYEEMAHQMKANKDK